MGRQSVDTRVLSRADADSVARDGASTRRRFLAGSALAALGSAVPVALRARGAQTLDLDDPGDNLTAFIKLIGSLDGAPAYDMVRGEVYALTPGRPAQPLFRTLGAGVASYTRRSPLEYRAVTRYLGFFLDWDSGQPLATWRNPLNDVDCTPPVTRYGPWEMRVLGDRMLALDSPDSGGGVRPWYRIGDVLHMQRVVLQETVAHPLFPKGDLMTYSGSWDAVQDPETASVPSQLSFSAVESWRPWMKLDPAEIPGTTWWHVTGVKLASAAAYPPALRQLIAREDERFFAGT